MLNCCSGCRCRKAAWCWSRRVNEGIVPTLQELIGLRALVLGRRAARLGRHGVQGHALSNLRGRGMEYAESREYAPGDDARHIDWRLTARSGRAHTKLYQAERERLTLLLADTTPALYFGTRVRFKSVQAARAGALVAWLAMRDGDRVAALRGSAREAPVPPAAGSRGALRVLEALARWYAQPPKDDAGLAAGLEHARRLLRPGSRLLLLADPSSVLAVPEAHWRQLAHCDASALLLTDPLELQPPKMPLTFVTAAEERLSLALDAPAVRARWQQAFAHPLRQAQDVLQRCGIRAQALSCDAASDSWLDVLDRPRPGARR